MTEKRTKLNNSRCDSPGTLRELKKKIVLRAGLIIVTILLTAVLFFSLTAAWYTNVAGAGGLTFEAKQWDFDGRIIFSESDVLSMAPGDSGIIPMQITNDGEEIAAASVTVSKEQLSEKMQERLYFYVDTPLYRNGERMDRVYVSSNSSYTYTLLPGSEINITEDTQNAPALKWNWVYDVLGYYILGTVTDADVDIVEYIRPIEYDYDFTCTTFDTNGMLATIDGITTADEFVKQISKNDGYNGEIDVTKKQNGYYPVYVNSSGYGVWAYLCSYEQIVENMQYDTQIGESVAEQYKIDITVTGSNSRETTLDVGDKSTFLSIIETSNLSNIKLTSSIILDEPVDITRGSITHIDLNGYTITSDQKNIFNAEEGSKLTLVNGAIIGDGVNTVNGITSNGAEIVLNKITMTGIEEGIKVTDHLSDGNYDSRIYMVDCNVSAKYDALWIYGNNGEDNTETTIIVERCNFEGREYMGIICNGSYKNVNIQVIDSTVSGYYTAVYHPQKDSKMLISNSTLTGMTGIVIKGGTIDIIDSVIRGIGTEPAEPENRVSGFTDTCDGIYLEGNYEWPAIVNVSGDKTLVTSETNQAVRLFQTDATVKEINISGGKYNTDVSAYLADGATLTTDNNYYTVTAP